jgi:hypothetical protein
MVLEAKYKAEYKTHFQQLGKELVMEGYQIHNQARLKAAV